MNSHSGMDIHSVGNMRGSIQLIRELLNDTTSTEEEVMDVLRRLEKKQNEFFMEKFRFYHRQ